GRAPVRFSKLEQLVNMGDQIFQETFQKRINSKELYLSCMYSPHKMKFPKTISEDLAYCTGIILGDGTLSGDSQNRGGNWGVSAIFDNFEHLNIFEAIIKKEFNISAKIGYPKNKKCYVSYFGSKPVHWFLRSYFDMHNGYKASKISIPKVILESTNIKIKTAFLQGLFDSDGTIAKRKKTRRDVRFSSTSQTIVNQVDDLLNSLNIPHGRNTWLKNEKVLPLYTVSIQRKSSVLSFAQQIGFRHPGKAAKLAMYSPVV
ncbi:MAG: LAGLIDADG family homing endonuclease, partial [archaeon]